MTGSAIFSDCGKYRYLLRRGDRHAEKKCLFIMLNPSTADAERDDPTIRRCRSFAERWGYGELLVVNLFAYRATSPKELRSADDPVGPDNRHWVERAVRAASCEYDYDREEDVPPFVVCAWGNHGSYMGQDQTMLGWLEAFGVEPSCLSTTKARQPGHPLYLPQRTLPMPYDACGVSGELSNLGGAP